MPTVSPPPPPEPLLAAVIRPLASTVMLALVYEPADTPLLAKVATAPDVVTSPERFTPAVVSPFALIVVAAKVPMFELTVASVTVTVPGPEALASPDRPVR